MCISNIGNRRPFPTNGFKSRGVVDAVKATSPTLSTSLEKNGSVANSTSNPSKHYPHIIVQHNYHDHSHDNRVDYQEDQPARGGVTTPFPLKLHDMLSNVAKNGHEHIVSWQPHGRCFVVHKPKEFVTLLPHYFKLSKLASFQRQLNLYGFQRLTRGRDRGGYYHELFLHGKVFLAHSIQRVKVKGTGVRARSNPEQEPDFWTMPWVATTTSSALPQDASSASPVTSCAMPQHLQLLQQQQPSSMQMRNQNSGLLPESFFAQQFPMDLEPTAFPDSDITTRVFDDDDLFGKHFHIVSRTNNNDTTKPQQPDCSSNPSSLFSVDPLRLEEQPEIELRPEEMDAFFEDFDFPYEDVGDEIEDDEVFGNLLEQMIST